jgi:Phosphodiester glycosidase
VTRAVLVRCVFAAACAVLTATAAVRAAGVEGSQPLATGTFVRGSFVADRVTVDVQSAVFARDAVTLHVVEYPLGGPSGEMVRRALGPDDVAAITGGYFTQGNRPRGLLVLGGSVHEPPRNDLSGIVGSAADGAPVVAVSGTVATSALRDAVQAGPFVVDPGGLPGIHRNDRQHARRAIVIVSERSIAFAFTSSCTLYDLMNELLRYPETFGVEHVERALNLSGGPTAGLAVRLPGGEIEGEPERLRVRTVLTIRPRTLPR